MKRRLPPFTKLGAVFLKFMDQHGMDYTAFAEKLNVPYSSANQWVVGKSTKTPKGTIRTACYPTLKYALRIVEKYPELLKEMQEAMQ